jgi:pimeloyl-ACP methyl ester carboxylesterase
MRVRTLALLLIAVTVAAAVLASAAGQRAQTRLAAQYPPVGKMVDVGGYRLHLHCVGAGSPTVVFEGGAGFAPGLALAHLQRAASAHTRACVYDRAGQGWSDASPRPRTAAVIVDELHTLLTNGGEPGPYVLVGWSYGGLTMRLFAYEYPDRVAGVVLVDSSHERQIEALGGRTSPVVLRVFEAVPALVATGWPALVPQWVPRVDGGQMPADAAQVCQALTVMSPKMAEAAVAEMQSLSLTLGEVAAARRAAPEPYPLGAVPLVVLMKGQSEVVPGLAMPVEEQQRVWLELQHDLAAQSSRGELIVAEHSGHNLPYQQPELVLAAIERLATGAQAGYAP